LAVILNIKTYLQSCETTVEETVISNTAGDTEYLRAKAVEIEHAIENVDFDSVESLLEELFEYKWDDSVYALLSRLKNGISMFDYDDVENAIHTLLNETANS